MSEPVAGTAGYARDAVALAEQYEGVAFEEVHHDVLHWFPDEPSRVVDIGAGTGRDAAALARRGHAVVAVEPTREFREIGARLHPGLLWVDDSLPALASVRGAFDVVLLSAVWMHLDPSERATAMTRLAGLLAPRGRVIMSLRHGPVPDGRRMFAVSEAETVDAARRHGLEVAHSGRTADFGGRPGVWWSTLVLRAGQP